MVPSGDPMVPGSDPIEPGGDPIAPGGDPMAPGGDPIAPCGDPIALGGDSIAPGGNHTAPGGNYAALGGDCCAGRFSGKAAARSLVFRKGYKRTPCGIKGRAWSLERTVRAQVLTHLLFSCVVSGKLLLPKSPLRALVSSSIKPSS